MMKLNLILFTICALFLNFANGYFISENIHNQIKNKLSNVFANKPNKISGIISAPEFGISHEPTEITDDDNQVDDGYIDDDDDDDDDYDDGFTNKFIEINFKDKNNNQINKPRPIPFGRPEQLDKPEISGGSIEHFPRPKSRFGNLRGQQPQIFSARPLHISNYIADETIIEYNELVFFGPESNPNAYPSKFISKNLKNNAQSECDTANYLRKAGFPESSIGTMICIANYESGFNCDATNVNTDSSTDYGEFQINSYWWCSGDSTSVYNGCDIPCSSLFDCQTNANCAYIVWSQQGFNAWYGYQNHKSTCDNYPIPC